MRGFVWLCIVGILLAVAAFAIAAIEPMTNPWPSLIAGFCVTAVGILLLTAERGPRDEKAR
jgi:hypothetical protein